MTQLLPGRVIPGSGPGRSGCQQDEWASDGTIRDNRHVPPPAGTHRRYVSYIDKSRNYYAAQGYEQPYRWAVNTETPFTRLRVELADATIGVITTSARTLDDQRGPFAERARPVPARMETSHLSWHKSETHTDDLGTFLPLEHLEVLTSTGEIGGVSGRFYGLPTNYSHRRTIAWSEQIATWAHEDEVDLMLLVPL